MAVSGFINKKIMFQIEKGGENLKPVGFRNGSEVKMDLEDFLKFLQPNTEITFDLKRRQVRDKLFKMHPK